MLKLVVRLGIFLKVLIGKFIWIRYEDNWETMEDGGVASGSIEDAPIHHDGRYYDDINYSKIAFALIPVDDF